MADEKSEKLQVNVDFTGFPDLFRQLGEMVEADMTDRSKFIRKLVFDEVARRQQIAMPFVSEGAAKKTRRMATAA